MDGICGTTKLPRRTCSCSDCAWYSAPNRSTLGVERELSAARAKRFDTPEHGASSAPAGRYGDNVR